MSPRSRFQFTGLAACVALAAFIYFQQSKNSGESKETPPDAAELTAPATPSPTSQAPAQKTAAQPAAPGTPSAPGSTPALGGEEGLRQVLKTYNFYQPDAMYITKQKLEEIEPDPARLAAFFLSELQAAGMEDESRRERVIWLANAMQLPEFVPLWQDVALRKTPRYPREGLGGHDVASGIARIEQQQAIRNLGLQAARNADARETLVSIILTPDPKNHDVFLRERALSSLREADQTASLRVLRQLSQNDPIFDALKGSVKEL